MTRARGRRGGLVWGLLLAVMAGPASAQQDEPPLRGPRVESRRPPGFEQRFGDGPRRMAERMIPARLFMQAMQSLRDGPPEVRPTPAQEARFAEMNEGLRESVRRQGQQRREAGAPDEEERREAMRRANQAQLDWQARIWSELNEPQRRFLEARLSDRRRELEQQRDEMAMQERLGRTRQDGRPPLAPGAREPGPAAFRERWERLGMQIARLAPEERERLLSRLEQEMQRREAEPRGQAQRVEPRRRLRLEAPDAPPPREAPPPAPPQRPAPPRPR